MKKTLMVTLIVLVALATVATVAFAEQANTTQATVLGIGMGGGRGSLGLTNTNDPLHTYMIAALASSLKLTSADLEAQLTAGKSLYDIAVAQGIAVDKISTLISDARSAAIDAAVKDGVLTQAEADWMKANQQAGHQFGGLLEKYEVGALASALKITTAEVEARFATGQSAYDIVVAKGIATDQISTVLTNARTAAIDAALKDGVITQAQADAMKSNSNAHGFGFGPMLGGMFSDGMHGGRGGHGPHGDPNQTQTTQP